MYYGTNSSKIVELPIARHVYGYHGTVSARARARAISHPPGLGGAMFRGIMAQFLPGLGPGPSALHRAREKVEARAWPRTWRGLGPKLWMPIAIV